MIKVHRHDDGEFLVEVKGVMLDRVFTNAEIKRFKQFAVEIDGTLSGFESCRKSSVYVPSRVSES